MSEKTNDRLEDAIAVVRVYLAEINPYDGEARLAIVRRIMEGYCMECGQFEFGGKCYCHPAYDV